MCAVHDGILKDFQSNLLNFVNSVENIAISSKNIAQIINHVDQTTSYNKSYLALLDWSQNVFIMAERFEADFKSQLASCIGKEAPQQDSIRMTMGNIYEKYLFFLNHMAHSFIDIDEQSPLSASNFDCQSTASGPPPNNSQLAFQRFRLQQQNYMSSYRRWSEANAMDTNTESNFDINRRWSMPTSSSSTNVNKNRLNVIPKLAGLVGNTLSPQQQQSSQSSNNDSSDEWAAIQLLSLKPPLQSRPPSQMQQHTLQPFQYQSRSTQQQRTQRQSRGELNEILILQRPNDPIFLGRCQQIAENIRGESDEY